MKLTNDDIVDIAVQLVLDFLQEESLKDSSDIRAAEVWLSIQADDWTVQADELPAIESFIDSFMKTERLCIEARYKESLPPDDLRASYFPTNVVRARLLKAIKVEPHIGGR